VWPLRDILIKKRHVRRSLVFSCCPPLIQLLLLKSIFVCGFACHSLFPRPLSLGPQPCTAPLSLRKSLRTKNLYWHRTTRNNFDSLQVLPLQPFSQLLLVANLSVYFRLFHSSSSLIFMTPLSKLLLLSSSVRPTSSANLIIHL
jgi:hypothetical protein